MKVVRTVVSLVLLSASLFAVQSTVQAEAGWKSQCIYANVGPLELDAVSGPLSYGNTVYLYQDTRLKFTATDGLMTPAVTYAGTVYSPGATNFYIFEAPANGFYFITVNPSLGHTIFTLRCSEPPADPYFPFGF